MDVSFLTFHWVTHLLYDVSLKSQYPEQIHMRWCNMTKRRLTHTFGKDERHNITE